MIEKAIANDLEKLKKLFINSERNESNIENADDPNF